MARKRKSDADSTFAAELEGASSTGNWIPTASEIANGTPDKKHFFLVEAAQDLMSGKLLTKSVAEFVGDLVLARRGLRGLRKAARNLAQGKTLDTHAAHLIATWLLTVKFRGRPPASRPKEQRIAADFYRRKRTGTSSRSAISALACEYRCTSAYIKKCKDRYASMATFDDSLLDHLCIDERCRMQGIIKNREPAKPSSVALDLALFFVRTALESGPIASLDIYRDGMQEGHSKRTLNRAKKLLNVESKRGGSQWLWALPSRLPNT